MLASNNGGGRKKIRADYDQRLLDLYDGYAHGLISRRHFLDHAAAFTATGISAAALLSTLSPDYALANQVSPDDPSIEVGYQALDAAGKDYTEYTYPNANHGFHNDTTPRYDKDSAALAWRRTIEFFRENLV